MAIYLLDVPDSPDTVFTTLFDGVAYNIKLQWNGRDQSWQMSLGRQNQPYLFKTKITTNTDLLKAYRALDNVPKGVLIAIDKIKLYGRITRDGFSSKRWQLYYMTADEYNEIKSTINTQELLITTSVENDNRFTVSEEPL
jgi:hypothetical protein